MGPIQKLTTITTTTAKLGLWIVRFKGYAGTRRGEQCTPSLRPNSESYDGAHSKADNDYNNGSADDKALVMDCQI